MTEDVTKLGNPFKHFHKCFTMQQSIMWGFVTGYTKDFCRKYHFLFNNYQYIILFTLNNFSILLFTPHHLPLVNISPLDGHRILCISPFGILPSWNKPLRYDKKRCKSALRPPLYLTEWSNGGTNFQKKLRWLKQQMDSGPPWTHATSSISIDHIHLTTYLVARNIQAPQSRHPWEHRRAQTPDTVLWQCKSCEGVQSFKSVTF